MSPKGNFSATVVMDFQCACGKIIQGTIPILPLNAYDSAMSIVSTCADALMDETGWQLNVEDREIICNECLSTVEEWTL